MNKWNGIGNLTKDIELNTTPSGISVAKFTVAVSRRFTNADGERETDFINCIAWRKQAENLAKYCHKGDKIAVVGELQTRTYESRDGIRRSVAEIIVDEIEFLNTKKDGAETKSKPHTPIDELQPADDIDEGLPF